MSNRRATTVVLLAIALAVTLSRLFALAGEPQSLWLWNHL